MNINLSLSPEANLVALLNSLNGTTLVEANVAFSNVETLVEQPTNSRVVVNAGTTPAFSGSDWLYYNRISAANQLATNDQIEVLVTADMNDAQLLAACLAKFPLHNADWRFVAAQKPANANLPGFLAIAAKPESLLYRGEYVFKLLLSA